MTKNFLPLLFCCLFFAASVTGTLHAETHAQEHGRSAPAKQEPAGWKQIWSDEFDGELLDKNKWNLNDSYGRDACFGGGNQERQCYREDLSHIRLLDGFLFLIAHPQNNLSNNKKFNSARIQTRGKLDIKYGKIEARIKLPTGQGVWPAFWMLPSERVYGDWPHSGEIDIMEAINLGTGCKNCTGKVENRVYGSLYFSQKWPRKGSKTHPIELVNFQAFNTYALEWGPESISWLINGTAYATVKAKDWHSRHPLARKNAGAPFDQKFHLILNLAIGGNWPENQNQGGVSLDGFPKALIVDYVRVYKCTSGPGTCTKPAAAQ